jgi:hypothetical protein
MADRLIFSLACCCFALPALAQSGLADPTRPPLAMGGDAAALAEAGGPVLQSVMIPKKGKPTALIGGQLVVLGGLYGESRLVSLTDREAVLEGPAGTERLYLTPGIEKINIIAKSPVVKSGQSRGKP